MPNITNGIFNSLTIEIVGPKTLLPIFNSSTVYLLCTFTLISTEYKRNHSKVYHNGKSKQMNEKNLNTLGKS